MVDDRWETINKNDRDALHRFNEWKRELRKQFDEEMLYTVYEVFPDGKKFFRFESNDLFDCEVYVDHHIYDHKTSKLVIE